MKFLVVFAFAAFLALPGQGPGNPLATFESANKSYEEGKFSEAITGYNQLLQSGRGSAPVYYNLGNAYFKLGQLGHAVASYRAAQLLSPRDPDLRANLQLARTRARGGLPFQTEWWRNWLGKLSLNEWTFLTAGALWVMFAMLAYTQWRPERSYFLRKYIAATGCAALFFGICFLIQLNADYITQTAIVTAGEAEVRNGPLDESPGLYKVRDGVELKVLDRIGNGAWLQVMDSAQRVGWLRADQAIIFNGPAIKSRS